MTATEWQSIELNKLDDAWKKERIDGKEYSEMKYEIHKVAKEMEKKQIIDAANWNGYFDNPKPGTLNGEQYYKQKFKKLTPEEEEAKQLIKPKY
jgi:hypothetical protein